MAKGPKGFTEPERVELKNKLCVECEKSWAIHGYKKTSVGELTAKIGISTGAFYLLYSSKEDLFCDTIERIQNRLKIELRNIVCQEGGKSGFVKSLSWQFREYDKYPFLYDFNSSDFMAFLNKRPKDRIEELKFDNTTFFHELIKLANLTFKIDEEKAFAIISTLLYTVTIKERLPYNHFETFDFLLNGIIDDLFDEKH